MWKILFFVKILVSAEFLDKAIFPLIIAYLLLKFSIMVFNMVRNLTKYAFVFMVTKNVHFLDFTNALHCSHTHRKRSFCDVIHSAMWRVKILSNLFLLTHPKKHYVMFGSWDLWDFEAWKGLSFLLSKTLSQDKLMLRLFPIQKEIQIHFQLWKYKYVK